MKKFFALLVCGCWFFTAFAQDDGFKHETFGMDFTLSAEKRIRRGMSFTVEGEARTQENTSKMERWAVGGEFDLRLFQSPDKRFNLKASAGWKYMWRFNLSETTSKYETEEKVTPTGTTTETYYEGYNVREGYWRGRHRTSISVAANYKLNKRWSFQLKETFQYTHSLKDSTTVDRYRLEDEDDLESIYQIEPTTKVFEAKDQTALRTRLMGQYNIRHCPVNPFASIEYGFGLNYTANKWRFILGTDINLDKNKQHQFEIYYRYVTQNGDEDPNGHLLCMGYQFKF